MGELVYLLGAGASCNSLPLNVDMETEFSRLAALCTQTVIPDHVETIGVENSSRLGQYRNEFISALHWASRKAHYYVTVDAFAKKCVDNHDDSDLRRIKSVLSASFLAWQALKPVDRRYRHFLSELLKDDGQSRAVLPQNVKIVTWNYDTQLETVYSERGANDNQILEQITFNRDQIIRLNGYTTAAINKGHGDDFMASWKHPGTEALPLAYNLYHQLNDDNKNVTIHLYFAFEHDLEAAFLTRLPSLLGKTSTLVIVGYSMPITNREIDRLLFRAMPNLETIYCQVPMAYEQELHHRISSIYGARNAVKVVFASNLDTFYIPYEIE